MANLKTIFDRRKKASNVTKGAVEIEVYFSRNTRKYIPTGVFVYDYQFTDHELYGGRATGYNGITTRSEHIDIIRIRHIDE